MSPTKASSRKDHTFEFASFHFGRRTFLEMRDISTNPLNTKGNSVAHLNVRTNLSATRWAIVIVTAHKPLADRIAIKAVRLQTICVSLVFIQNYLFVVYRFFFKLVIDFQCHSSYEVSTIKKIFGAILSIDF